MGKNLQNVDSEGWYQDCEKVSDYYCDRLSQLEKYAQTLGKQALFVDSERIITDTEQVLRFLSDRLALSQPLSANYSQFSHTGIPGKGDTSNLIKQGTVVKTKSDKHRIELPAGTLSKASEAYERCRNTMHRYADCL